MPDKRFGLHFYLKKLKSYWKGILPTYLRITVDGIPKELFTKRDYDLTREKYGRTCRFAQSFIKIKYKFNDFPIQSLNPGLVNQYEIWLKMVRNGRQNAIMKYTSILSLHMQCYNLYYFYSSRSYKW